MLYEVITNFGMWAGFTIITLLGAVFCSLLNAVLPKIELVMKIIGAAYMLYLAYRTVFSKPHETGEAEPVKNSFLTGILLQFVNPKIMIYVVVSMEAYILPHVITSYSIHYTKLYECGR